MPNLSEREIWESQKRLAKIKKRLNGLAAMGIIISVAVDYSGGTLVIGNKEKRFNNYNQLKLIEQHTLNKLQIISQI